MNKRINIALICFLSLGFLFLFYRISFVNEEVDTVENNPSFFKNGRWIHEQDSLAGIEIKNDQMIFFYKGEETLEDDIYEISFTKSISNLSDSSTRKVDFIELTNQQDTMRFEVLGYDETVLSLLFHPTGRIHVYVPEIKD